MAIATHKQGDIEYVTLKLNMAEARTLRTILANIGGSPEHTLRKFTQEISDSMDKAGIPEYSHSISDYQMFETSPPGSVGLYFASNTLNRVRPGEDEPIEE